MQFYEQTLSNYNKITADPKKKNYFQIAATLALLIILVVMIYPAIQHIAKVNKEIETNKVIDKALADKITNLGLAQDNLRDVQDDLPLVEKALPTGSDIKNYIKAPLESLAAKHGLTLKSVQFSDIPVSPSGNDEKLAVRDIDFTVSLIGNFTTLNSFLKDAETFIRVTSVRTLDIKGSGGQQTMTVSATTNYLGNPLLLVPNQVQKGAGQ